MAIVRDWKKNSDGNYESKDGIIIYKNENGSWAINEVNGDIKEFKTLNAAKDYIDENIEYAHN